MPLGKWNMSGINKLTSKLRKAPQPPLSHVGAPADADRAKRPALVQPSAPDSELNPGDRVEGLANFGKPTGEFGTVESLTLRPDLFPFSHYPSRDRVVDLLPP
jgi:hypothetical protein